MPDICAALRAGLRQELNHLLTERPFRHAGGEDSGWFCREHALLVAALAQMFGQRSELCLGDLVLIVPNDLAIAMVDTGEDHAWCRVDGAAPVDASLTIRHYAAAVPDVTLICPDCPEDLSAFTLQYVQRVPFEQLRAVQYTDVPLICYNERRVHREAVPRLLDRPYSFLLRPPPGTQNLLQLYGNDVLFHLVAHMHRLSLGETASVRGLGASAAIREIVTRDPRARTYVLERCG